MSEYPGLPKTLFRAYRDIFGNFLKMVIPLLIFASLPVILLSSWSPRGASFAVIALGVMFFRSSLRRSLNPEEAEQSDQVFRENAKMSPLNVFVVASLLGVLYTSVVAGLGTAGGLGVDYLSGIVGLQTDATGALATAGAILLPVIDVKLGNLDRRFSILGQTIVKTLQALTLLRVVEVRDWDELGDAVLSYTH